MAQPASEAMYARTRQLLRSLFQDKGMTVSFGTNEDGEFFDINGMGMINPLINVVDKLRFVDPKDWRAWAEDYATAVEEALGVVDSKASDHPHEKLLSEIRVRVMDYPPEVAQQFSYAPELIPNTGLKKVLCIDGETTISYLTDSQLADIDISTDELYEHAQRNVDASPIDDDDIEYTARVRGISGSSSYTAAKVINMRHLVDTIIGPAPDGVIFGIPHRDLIIYCVPTIDEVMSFINEAGIVVGLYAAHDEIEKPGGVLSGNLYYWSPDGTYELLGWLELDADKKPESFALAASPELKQRLHIVVGE